MTFKDALEVHLAGLPEAHRGARERDLLPRAQRFVGCLYHAENLQRRLGDSGFAVVTLDARIYTLEKCNMPFRDTLRVDALGANYTLPASGIFVILGNGVEFNRMRLDAEAVLRKSRRGFSTISFQRLSRLIYRDTPTNPLVKV